MAAYLVPLECALDWVAVLRFVVCEVVRVEDAADLPRVVGDALGDVALVEGVVARADAVDAVAGGGVLRGDHALQHIGEVLLHQQRTRLRHIAIVEEYVRAAGREQLELLPRPWAVEALQHIFVVGEAELGVVDCGRKHFAKRLRAVSFQQGCERGDDGGNREGHRRVRARSGRYLIEAARLVEVHARLCGRGALTAEREQVAAARVVHHEDAFREQRIVGERLGYACREGRRDYRIEGVAAVEQHSHARHGCEVMPTGNDALRAVHDGPAGGRAHHIAFVYADVIVGGGHFLSSRFATNHLLDFSVHVP